MKKIIIVILTITTILFTLVISASAVQPNEVEKVLEFTETSKAYPIANSVDNVQPFFEYYSANVHSDIHFTKKHEENILSFSAYRNANGLTIQASIAGSYPHFGVTIIEGQYNDFGICFDSENIVVVGFKDGRKVIANSDLNQDLYDSSQYWYFEDIIFDEPTEGYYISYPTPTIEESLVKPLIMQVIDSVKIFVTGIGSAFTLGFTTIFLANGSLNALGITILVFFGIALGYGCIRWITGLFRKESN